MISTEDADLCPRRVYSLERVVLGLHIVCSKYNEDRGCAVSSAGMQVGAENWTAWEGVGQEGRS